jgi:hypothetical protein
MLPRSERILYLVCHFDLLALLKNCNISVIVSPTHYDEMEDIPPLATLFLHEDLVARTLDFELDVKRWRLAEIEAGRGDPGRPNYLDAFSVSDILRPSVQF